MENKLDPRFKRSIYRTFEAQKQIESGIRVYHGWDEAAADWYFCTKFDDEVQALTFVEALHDHVKYRIERFGLLRRSN